MADTCLAQQQRELTNWLRNPNTAKPANISADRLAIYRELVFNNISGFLDVTFPVAAAMLTTPVWDNLKKGFFSEFICKSPLFSDISLHFREYLTEHHSHNLLPYPWLHELLHYEWMELVVDTHEDTSFSHHKLLATTSYLNTERIALADRVWPLAYQWPVHQWHAQTNHSHLQPSPTCLLAFREMHNPFSVRIIQVDPLLAFALELLTQFPDGLSLSELCSQMMSTSEHLPNNLPDRVLALLNECVALGVPFADIENR